MVLIFGDGCGFGALVLWRLRTTTTPPSTTTSSLLTSAARLDGGARTIARLRLILVPVAVARWSKDQGPICNFYYF